MKKLLTPELDKKYGSQLEYMGHMNLESMQLNDGNTALIENDIFYIVDKNTVDLSRMKRVAIKRDELNQMYKGN